MRKNFKCILNDFRAGDIGEMLRTTLSDPIQRTSAKNNTPAPEKETEDIAIFDKNFNGYTARKTCLPPLLRSGGRHPAARAAYGMETLHVPFDLPCTKRQNGTKKDKNNPKETFQVRDTNGKRTQMRTRRAPRNVPQRQTPSPRPQKRIKKSVVCPVGGPKVPRSEDPSIDLTFLSAPCNRLERLSFLNVVFFYQISLMNEHRNDNATHAPDQESQYIYNIRNHFF